MPVMNNPRTAHGRGRTVPPPSWWTAMAVGSWAPIAGTANIPGGLTLDAFSDITLRPSDSSIVVVAAGGHNDGNSNAAASIRLTDNSPTWALRKASTWNGVEKDVTYYADGLPASRHTYHHSHYIASLDAILLAGCRYGWGGTTPAGDGMDLFSLTTNDYLPRYTFPDINPTWSTAGFGIVQDGAGNIWTANAYKFTVATKTWSKPGTGTLLRYPAAYDSIRDRIFALQFNDGEDSGSAGVVAKELDPSTAVVRSITFSASAAYTQFVADTPSYAGMAFCPLDGKFYFMCRQRVGTFYVVTPNTSSVWDMAVFTPGGTTFPSPILAVCKRVLWVPALSGFVLHYNNAQPLHFLRMA